MSTKTEREMLELAAKAAGIKPFMKCGPNNEAVPSWNPLDDDGDALRLAVKLNISVEFDDDLEATNILDENREILLRRMWFIGKDKATRLAIVKAAAEIGRSMSDE